MDSFSFQHYLRDTPTACQIDVMLSGGAYAIAVNGAHYGVIIKDDSAPLGYATSNEKLIEYLAPVAARLKKKSWQNGLKELPQAIIGTIRLIAFLLATIVGFNLKRIFGKLTSLLSLNLLPVIFDLGI
ncbi:hypothetical protein [Pedobacter soli]|uniref:Uncharacterized protein n=1 Tax=Pedobacter soli TaxID=390242 RepID=A0A1G6JVA6_9SPHI|nr:hypothetical protein [Pedobacter soli]SDC22598.1 hypothetical protein SAMN04488024_101566 [Pedobacter soli]